MNIGQLPPFFIWPYALFHLLTGRSLFFMLEVLSREQEKYNDFYDRVKAALENTAKNSMNICENSFEGDGYGQLMEFAKNAILLFFGGIFLVLLKLYILIRHLNYMTFVILFYWGSLVVNTNEHNLREELEELEEQD